VSPRWAARRAKAIQPQGIIREGRLFPSEELFDLYHRQGGPPGQHRVTQNPATERLYEQILTV